ncbi:hypothetical protein ACTXT7_014784 [Hymenolepis weldensis]
MSQEEEIVEEISNALHSWYRMRHRRNLRSRYPAVTFKPKASSTELDTCDLPSPWNPETPETQCNHRPDRYSGLFRKPRMKFKGGRREE